MLYDHSGQEIMIEWQGGEKYGCIQVHRLEIFRAGINEFI